MDLVGDPRRALPVILRIGNVCSIDLIVNCRIGESYGANPGPTTASTANLKSFVGSLTPTGCISSDPFVSFDSPFPANLSFRSIVVAPGRMCARGRVSRLCFALAVGESRTWSVTLYFTVSPGTGPALHSRRQGCEADAGTRGQNQPFVPCTGELSFANPGQSSVLCPFDDVNSSGYLCYRRPRDRRSGCLFVFLTRS